MTCTRLKARGHQGMAQAGHSGCRALPAHGILQELTDPVCTMCPAMEPGMGSLAQETRRPPHNWVDLPLYSVISSCSGGSWNCTGKTLFILWNTLPVAAFLPTVVVQVMPVLTGSWKGLFWKGPRGRLIQPPAEKRATDQGLLPCQAVLSISSKKVPGTCLGSLWCSVVAPVELEFTLGELCPLVPCPATTHPCDASAWPSLEAPLGDSGDSFSALGKVQSDCHVSCNWLNVLSVLSHHF